MIPRSSDYSSGLLSEVWRLNVADVKLEVFISPELVHFQRITDIKRIPTPYVFNMIGLVECNGRKALLTGRFLAKIELQVLTVRSYHTTRSCVINITGYEYR